MVVCGGLWWFVVKWRFVDFEWLEWCEEVWRTCVTSPAGVEGVTCAHERMCGCVRVCACTSIEAWITQTVVPH